MSDLKSDYEGSPHIGEIFSVRCGSCETVHSGPATDVFDYIRQREADGWTVPMPPANVLIKCPTCRIKS